MNTVKNMVIKFGKLGLRTTLPLLVCGLAISAFGQLQWSSYNTSGNLVTANVASGGDATYGKNVSFTVPASTEMIFMTKSFAPISLTNGNAALKVNFFMSANGALYPAGTGRLLGMGLFNDPDTPASALDDQGYWVDFNAGNPDFELFYRPNTTTTFFQYDSAHKLGSGHTSSGYPSNNIVYGMQFQLNMNASASAISIGTSGSVAANAGAAMTNAGVTQLAYSSSVALTTLPTTNFNEFAFMFNNTATTNVTVTLSGITLVPANPGISTNPADVNGSPGSTATFTVGINTNSATPLSYRWYEIAGGATNGLTDGTTANGSTIAGATTNTLTVSNAQIADSGFVFVVVSNSFGATASAPALLNIANASAPSIFSLSLTNANLVAGQGTNVTVRATGVPAPDYYWYDNSGKLIQAGAADSTLVLTNLQLTNAGTYSVVASNYLGTDATNFIISLYTAPCIAQQPTNVLVHVGDPVTFTVVEGGCANPAPTYQWYKNGSPISSATNSSYSIASVALSDIGSYSVRLSNPGGSIMSASAKLAVYSPTMTGAPVSPGNNASGVCVDTPLSLTFNQPPTVGDSGTVKIYDATNSSTPVDTIDLGLNNSKGVQAYGTFPGDSDTFNYYPIMVNGDTATIYPHAGVLTTNQTYYVTIDPGVILDTNGADWAGITTPGAWQFTTKATGPANPTNIVVAADNSGDFDTVQGAVDFVPLANTTPTLINIRNGDYVGIVDIASKNNITLRGQSRAGAIVSYPNNANIALGGNTHTRMTFKVYANDITIENLTISNSTPQGGSQAEALTIDSGAQHCIIDNCNIDSRQDTILANVNSSQGFFYHSTIAGNYDYIWGGGNLFFQKCNFQTISGTSEFNLTAARTDISSSESASTPWVNPNGTTYSANGFSFVDCTFGADLGVANITLADKNGTPGGLASWVDCEFDSSAYVGPVSTITNSYVFWQHQNTALDGTTPISFAGVQTIGITNNDPRLLAATNVTTWFYGWTPQLAPYLTSQPADQTVNAGRSVSFTVGAAGFPDPTYQWTKDGTNLVGQTGATLTILSASGLDNGTYAVIVSNGSGHVTSSNAVLTVTAPTTPATIVSPAVTSNGSIQFTVNGAPGSAGFGYRVWATTNLALAPVTNTWTLITNGTFGTVPVVITDPTAAGLPQRFYIITVP